MKTCIVLNSYDVFLEHLHQVFSHSKDKLAKNKSDGARKLKILNRITKLVSDYICLTGDEPEIEL